jgi:AraC-like DNA-binding protein
MSAPRWQYAVSVVRRQISPQGLHVWPFRETFPLELRHYILNRQSDLPPHRPCHFELILLESGEITYEAQGVASQVKKGDLVVVGNELYHRMRKTEVLQPDVRARVLLFLPELVHTGSENGEDLLYLMPFLFQSSTRRHVIPAGTGIAAQVSELIHALEGQLPASAAQSRLIARTYVKMMLVLLSDYFSRSPDTKTDFRRISHAVEHLLPLNNFLEAHCSEPITAGDAARFLSMSAWRFQRFLKEATGSSFVPYLTRIRVARAKTLLAASDKSISDVSQESGFCDQSYLGYVFRKIAHITPLQYRRKCRDASRAIAALVERDG